MMRSILNRCGWMATALLALGLASCLTSDPPKLDAKDLVQLPELAGEYATAAFPPQASNERDVTGATVEAQGDGSYLLTFMEGDHKDSPTRMRLLDFKPATYLCVFTEADGSNDAAMYALVMRDPDGTWIFKIIDLKPDRRDARLASLVKRHGVAQVTFETHGPDITDDHLHGTLNAEQLRALFKDPAFIRATQTDTGFVLTSKR